MKSLFLGLLLLLTPAIADAQRERYPTQIVTGVQHERGKHCPNEMQNQRTAEFFMRHTGFPYGRPGYLVVPRKANCNCKKLKPSDFVWIRESDRLRVIGRQHNRCYKIYTRSPSENVGPWWDPNKTGKKKVKNNERWPGDIYRR